jgi:uncharacterized membrane protein
VTTTRCETFSDGVFAIAATLLILDVRADGPDLGRELLHIWPSYAAYAISFLIIGIMWVNHHVVFEQLARVDRTFLFINVFFLMLVAFVPFPTSLVAQHLRHSGDEQAAVAYGVTFTTTAVFYNALWLYASRGRRLLRDDADPRVVSGITRSYLLGPWIYLAATLTALASPIASVILFGVIAVFYMLESTRFASARGA